MYEVICGYKEGFSRVVENIEKLKQAKLNIVLRTMPIYETLENLDNLLSLMLSFKLPIEYSLYISPRRDSIDLKEVERLSPKQLLEFQKKFEAKTNVYYQKKFVDTINGFNCSAGKSAFFVNWQGEMSICSLFDFPKIDILKNGFEFAWQKLKDVISKSKKCNDCKDCKLNDFCYVCPAKLYSEGNIEECSTYLRECARMRFVDKNGKI